MTWQELHRRDQLPGDVTREMAIALDRQAAGEKLTPKARNRARQALRRIQGERYARHWAVEERIRQDEDGRVGRAGTAGLSRSGGAGPAAPSRAAAGSGGASVGGALALRRSSWNANLATADEYHRRLSMMGLDPSFHVVDDYTEKARATAKSPSLGLMVKQQRAQLDAAKRLAARSAELDRGKLDANSAPAEQVRRRMEALGIDHQLIASIREKPKPLEPLDRGPDPYTAAAAARAKAERAAKRLAAASKRGKPADAKTMAPDVFESYLKARGYWAGGL